MNAKPRETRRLEISCFLCGAKATEYNNIKKAPENGEHNTRNLKDFPIKMMSKAPRIVLYLPRRNASDEGSGQKLKLHSSTGRSCSETDQKESII
jgi:hypothetical protein